VSEKSHLTAVVVIPPRDVWEPIQAIRRAHDRQFRRWMPHINVVYPFRPPGALPEIIPRLRKTCAGIPSFEVRLERMGHFVHGGDRYTLWLEPEPASALRSLREAVQPLVPECDDLARFPGGYTPHLSVGQARGGRALEDLLAALARSWRTLSFLVDAIFVISRRPPPHDVFEVADRIPLGHR
jgi:2'-5' RNA ligase